MKNSLFRIFLAVCLIVSIQSCTQNEPGKKVVAQPIPDASEENLDWIVDELIVKWENNRDYCIETLEAMPEDAYTFQPVDSAKTFSEQASHIITTMHWQMEKLGFTELPEFQNRSKEQLIQSYHLLFAYLLSELTSMNGDQLKETVGVFYGESTKRRLLNLLDNHVTHHRAQMVMYLRMKGITPPSYRGW